MEKRCYLSRKLLGLFLSVLLLTTAMMFSSCGMGLERGLTQKVDDQGVTYLPSQSKNTYVLDWADTDDLKTNDVIINEFDGKPVTMISSTVSLGKFLFDDYKISLPNTIRRIACDSAYYKVERYIEKNGLADIHKDLGKYAIYDDGSVYMGNELNPYLILVYTNNVNYSTPEGTRLIANRAFSPYTESIHISSEVYFIDNQAFRNIQYSNTVIDPITGKEEIVNCSTKISVDDHNEYYSSDGSSLFNKDKTRVIHFGLETVILPDSVEYFEPYAIDEEKHDLYLARMKKAGFCSFENPVLYVPTASNPNFLLFQGQEDVMIDSNTRIIASFAMSETTNVTIPDSVVQIMPQAFDMDNLSICNVDTTGWYSSIHYADGYAYEYGIFYYVYKDPFDSMTYAKMGKPDKIAEKWGDSTEAADRITSPYAQWGYDWRRPIDD